MIPIDKSNKFTHTEKNILLDILIKELDHSKGDKKRILQNIFLKVRKL